MVKEWLRVYEPPALDEATAESIRDFIDRRKRELPDSVV
jgi:trimethylamine:corrinoid methyltransferase-like protein